ncbi:pre-mRNA cleavage complex 2 protein Pcf11 isoform X2 [Xyrichtys novacula]|uniref:Pre-mRNA cleavage complex 2 protein Pcf11 isoform X2 n=1 Tax=Xyrichtys novacula TaxID=13765 RepID=A0AAV1FSY6_XYRNO|nr:pre-mRNA cleavage complex 2 protein Pcf11 isoform X2 [Xyrichtys novacula]
MLMSCAFVLKCWFNPCCVLNLSSSLLLQAPPAEKLPVLYLVDSIVKNVGGEYLAVFAKNLITSFICVFEKVDENTRKSLFKLRSTWDDVFPLKKLYALDVRVNSVDVAWPIKPLPPTINASIHVNPKFLKQSEEVSSPPPVSPTQQPPPAPPPAAAPAPPPPAATPAVSQSSVTQEQLIRQQLLAKQKQLLELQQKKIELELEQTKAQLAGGFVMPVSTPVSASPPVNTAQKPTTQPAPVVRPWIPPQTQPDTKPPTRDPRLNRIGPTAPSQPKEQPAGKKTDTNTKGSPAQTPEKSRPEKNRPLKKDVIEEKTKSKSLSPIAKSVQSKTKTPEGDVQKSAEGTKKDPRLRKRQQDKGGDAKDDELKEKKRCTDKKEREDTSRGVEPQRSNKGKMVNGTVGKHDREGSNEKIEFKAGGNARTHARKRTRSRSRSRSPTASPKRKDRRSPKSRARSSLSPSPSHKPGKPRRVRADEPEHGKTSREDRLTPKKNQSESRRSKRPAEDRHSETRDSHSPRGHEGGAKDAKEAPHRWRSGWEENKHLKLSEDSHAKPGPQRHKQYPTPTRPTTPRTPKHRLSIDANLQIPEVLNSASKKDLLRRASRRLESGEISQDEFLNMAHQLKSFFQYQEEKQQHSDNWDRSGNFPVKKQPLLTTPPSAQPRPHDTMDAAELSYYEHKSKLRKTQVTHRHVGEEWEGGESPKESDGAGQGEKSGGRSSAGRRAPPERQGERRSKEPEEPRPPPGPMIEEYNHGKEFPTLKSLPGLRFRRRADPREAAEREWTSPLTERQRYDEQKSGYDAPRRYAPPADSRNPDPRRPEGPPSGQVVHRNCPSPAGLEAPAPRFERERLSPLHQRDSAEGSPVPRFESPNSEHSDDGPLDIPPPHPNLPPKSILKVPGRSGPLPSLRQHSDSPGHTPPHDGGHAPSRYDTPAHMGPSRQHPPGWYEGGGTGRYEDSSRFEGPHHPGPGRFEGSGPPHHNMSDRFDGPHMPHGPMRGGEGIGRFEGPPHPQGPVRFEGPANQQPPARFEGQGPGPGHFEGPMPRFNNMAPGPGPGPMGFQPQGPMRFDSPQNQMGPMRFEGPSPMRFDGPAQSGPRFDLPNVPQQGGPPIYECAPGQQGPIRFGPQQNMQPAMRPIAPPIYDGPMAPQQNFNMAPQRFLEPMNPQFSGGPLGFQTQTPNMQPATNFNIQPNPAFSQPGPAPFYNPAAPAVSMQQPVNMMNMNQPYLPQNPVPYNQPAPVVPPENHFGQVDVNDLLTKLISNGIIKPSVPDTTPSASTGSAPPGAPAAVVEEEEEEEQEEEDGDIPDLTSFSIDDMKQRYEGIVTRLYSGNQCCLCSMRFTTAQTDMYADHLDWHFRQNHAGKVASKKVTHRRWYYSLTDWIEFEEIADLEERAKSQFFEKENEEEVQKTQAAAKEKEFQKVKAAKDQVGELCEICQEPFETYWVEEEEDWFLKNALRVDDKNFHPSCFEDYKNSSYIDVTPSPSKLLTEHPLTALVKKEEEEEEETSCAFAAASTSQEVKSEESAELPEVKKEAELLTETQPEEPAE